jgi:hypothetical protein
MRSYVLPQMAFHGEGLVAKGALERFLSRVHSNVVSKTLSRCKRFLAMFTAMKLSSRMFSFAPKI